MNKTSSTLKSSYHRGTARRFVSIEIISTAVQHCLRLEMRGRAHRVARAA